MDQQLYFSFIDYGDLIALNDKEISISLNNFKEYDCLLLSGIANDKALKEFIEGNCKSVKHIAYHDHYNYSIKDVQKIKKTFESINSEKKILITTEKDFARLNKPEILNELKDVAAYYLPIEVKFHNTSPLSFNDYILSFVSNFRP